MNYRRGLIRLFVVFAICWYISGGLILWPKWYRALNAYRFAEHILTSSRNPDGTYTAYEDEIENDVSNPAARSVPKLKISPMRFLDWDKADREARYLRPIGMTIFFSVAPPVVYLLGLAVSWIFIGFRTPPSPGTHI